MVSQDGSATGQGEQSRRVNKAITEDAQNLVNYHAVKSASPALYTKLRKIAKEMVSLAPSLPVNEESSYKENVFVRLQEQIDKSLIYK